MRTIGWIGLALAVPGGLAGVGSAQAGDPSAKWPDFEVLAKTQAYGKGKLPAKINCKAPDAPYKDYSCLDEYLGDGFFERLVNYYRLELGHEVAPADPKAPPSRRDGWPGTPQAHHPMPFAL